MYLVLSILLQSIGFTAFLVWLNSILVRKLIDHGAKQWQSSEFHQANVGLRALFTYAVVWQLKTDVAWMAAVSFLIQTLLFDPLLNPIIGKARFYVGSTAVTDKIIRYGYAIRIPFTKHYLRLPGLGRYAGQIKAGVVLVVIIAILLRDAVYIGF